MQSIVFFSIIKRHFQNKKPKFKQLRINEVLGFDLFNFGSSDFGSGGSPSLHENCCESLT